MHVFQLLSKKIGKGKPWITKEIALMKRTWLETHVKRGIGVVLSVGVASWTD
jgi:hypothetical protein